MNSKRSSVAYVDLLFPDHSAAWRIHESQQFIERYDTDFLVAQPNSLPAYFGGRHNLQLGWRRMFDMTNASWHTLNESHQLWRYDVLIFNRRWNWLQRFNDVPAGTDPGFDGRRFNGNGNSVCAYMLRLKTKRHMRFHLDLRHYAAVYFIFVNVFKHFMDNVLGLEQTVGPNGLPVLERRRGSHTNSSPFSGATHLERLMDRHIVKVYPGGGWGSAASPAGCQQSVHYYVRLLSVVPAHIISTQAHTRDCLIWGLPNSSRDRHTFVLGGPGATGLKEHSVPPVPSWRPLPAPLQVCFAASVGSDPRAKGTFYYLQLVDRYMTAYPEDPIRFVSAGGGVPVHRNVTHIGQISQAALTAFFRHAPISIMFSMDRRPLLNGWPLGFEAATAASALLFSTDDLDMNTRNGLHFGAEFTKVNISDLDSVVTSLHRYARDRDLLHQHALLMHRRVSVRNPHMDRIFEVVDRVISQSHSTMNEYPTAVCSSVG